MHRRSNNLIPFVIALMGVSTSHAHSAPSAVKDKRPTKSSLAPIVSISASPARALVQGPYGEVRILVDAKNASGVVLDVSSKASFTFSNPSVATMDESGILRATRDGKTTLNI